MSVLTREPDAARELSTASVVRSLAYGLIALQIAVRAYVTFPSYYFQDDFAHLDLARRLGLSPDYLFRDYGGHAETGSWIVVWLVSHVVDRSFWPAAVTILLLQLGASLLLFWLLRELFGATPVVLVPLAVYLFTPLSLAWATWWSAALEALPLQLAMLSVLLCVVRLHRTGERRWAVWSVAAHVAGLLFWEKAALILPAALAVTVLLVAPSWGWRAKVAVLREHWRLWLVHLAVLVAYLAVYLTRIGSPAEGSGTFPVQQLLGQTLVRMYVPGLFGGPWHADGAENTLYPYADDVVAALTCALLAGVVVASFVVRGRRALGAWVLLVGYLAADLALLGLGRSDLIGLLARDPRYVADALPVTALALAAAFHERDARQTHRRAYVAFHRRATVPVVVNVVVVLVLSCLVTLLKLAPVAQHDYSSNFVAGVARQMEEHPERSVVSTAAPYVVSARADVAQMMNAVGADLEFDRPATEMYLFDGLATMRPMELLAGTQVERGPQGDCGWSVGDTWTSLGSVPPARDPVRVLRLAHLTPRAAVLSIRVGDETQRLQLPSGLGRAYFVIPSAGGELSARLSGPAGTCLTDWAAGPPWVAD